MKTTATTVRVTTHPGAAARIGGLLTMQSVDPGLEIAPGGHLRREVAAEPL